MYSSSTPIFDTIKPAEWTVDHVKLWVAKIKSSGTQDEKDSNTSEIEKRDGRQLIDLGDILTDPSMCSNKILSLRLYRDLSNRTQPNQQPQPAQQGIPQHSSHSSLQTGLEKKRICDPEILYKYKKTKVSHEHYPKDPLCSFSSRTRFKFVDGLIYIMDRDITSKLLESIKKAHGSKPGFYVQGPQGVGKSHSIYQVVCTLRKDVNNRVLYLPDCKGWVDALNKNFFFYQMVAIAFDIAEDNFVQVWSSKHLLSVSWQDPVNLLDKFLCDMTEHCKAMNLSIYMFFDQHNSLTDEQRYAFPLSIIESTLVTHVAQNLVVISGSANNKYALKIATDGQWPVFSFNNGFTDDEYNKWASIKKIKNDQDTFDKVKSVTSFIPIEVQGLLDLDTTNNFSQVDSSIVLYKEKRRNQISLQDIAFRREYLGEQGMLEGFIRSVVLMELNVPISLDSIFINQQLMVLRNGYVCPLIPMVVPILKSAYLKFVPYSINLASIYQSVFRGTIDLTADARGRIVEHYLRDRLTSMRKFSVLAKKINIVTEEEKGKLYDSAVLTDQSLIVNDYHLKEFSGNKFDATTNFNITLLIVPTSPNYPIVDFYFWDSTDKHLIPCQVTVGKTHKNKWSKKQSEMMKLLPKDSKISFLWIATEDLDVALPEFNNQFIVYLSDLMNDENFALLKDYSF